MEEKQDNQYQTPSSCDIYIPDVDILETDDAVVLYADLPGYSSDEILVDLSENVLKIQTVKPQKQLNEVKPIYLEYNCGIWMREFKLSGWFDETAIEAEIKQGVLKVVLPKKVAPLPRKIDIKK